MCSFCGKSHSEVKKLIAGPAVYICDECIQVCSSILEKELGENKSTVAETHISKGEVPTPEELSEKLNEFVIGQERAKKVLSVAV